MASLTKLCLLSAAFAILSNIQASPLEPSLEASVLGLGATSRSDMGGKLMGKSQTDWGKWSSWAFCPEEMWAVGAQQRVEPNRGNPGDDTALNAVRLLCAPLGEFGARFQSAEPHPGLWGDWTAEAEGYCPQSLVTGFDLKSESNQGGADDSGANSIRLMCSNRRDVELKGGEWGDWTEMQTCPKGQAVCGAQVQFEENQGNGDDTALNNVNMACCKIHLKSEDTCDQASDVWDTIMDCDSLESSAGLSCEYAKTVGTTSSKETSKTESKRIEKSLQVAIEAGVDKKGLSARFSETLGLSKSTGYDWTTAQSESFSTSTTITASYKIPPRKRVKMQQIVGKCGKIDVRTPSIRIVDV